MRKIIFYLMMAFLVTALGSCSSKNFVSNINRLDYVKTNKSVVKGENSTPEISEIQQQIIQKDSQESSAEARDVMEEEIIDKDINTIPMQSVTEDYVATFSEEEGGKLGEETISETINITPAYINDQSPKATTKEKSQLTALLLCIFLGLLGVHRFYIGKPLGGVIILGLTIIGLFSPPVLALAGLIVLVDAVRLLLGGLGPGW